MSAACGCERSGWHLRLPAISSFGDGNIVAKREIEAPGRQSTIIAPHILEHTALAHLTHVQRAPVNKSLHAAVSGGDVNSEKSR